MILTAPGLLLMEATLQTVFCQATLIMLLNPDDRQDRPFEECSFQSRFAIGRNVLQ